MNYLHSHSPPIYHRGIYILFIFFWIYILCEIDLKSGNVLLSGNLEDFTVKVSDFGLSCAKNVLLKISQEMVSGDILTKGFFFYFR